MHNQSLGEVSEMKISLAIAEDAPVAYPAIYKKDLFENMKKAKDFGYDGIEWHLRQPDKRKIEKMHTYISSLSMKVNAVGTGMSCLYDGLTLMHEDGDIRRQAVERLREFTDMAAELGSMVIIGSIKGKIPPGGDRDLYEKYCIESLKAVLDYAGQKGVTVLLEVLNRYETNFLNTAEEAHEFITRIGNPLLKMHIDTFHMNIEEAILSESILSCKETLGHMHFADSNRYQPGTGHIDFKAVLQALEKINYQGWIGVECLAMSDPDMAAEDAVKYIRSVNIS